MKKKYIVTTAQRGGLVNWNLLRGLQTYAGNNTEIIILPTNGRYPSSTKLDQAEVLNSFLENNFNVIEGDYKLSDKLDIRFFPVKAQQMDPTTSWDRFVAYQKSAIMPSPKQRLRVIPTSNKNLPKVLMSTGAITHPHYKENSWGTKAALDHVYGAIVVEIDDDESFHFRQLRANSNGVFYDLGVRYDGNHKPVSQKAAALIMGDIHCHTLDNIVWKGTKELIKETSPKNLVLHDLFDGYSINHHDVNNILSKTKKYGLSLEDELYEVGEFLKSARDLDSNMKIVVVKSNHDEVINRYLAEGRFATDPQNIDMALYLFQKIREGKDPLMEGIKKTYGRIKDVRFLSRDDDFKIEGYQLANHGDVGANGTRGSVRGMERAYGKAIRGHSHVPEIFRNVFTVGMSGLLKQDYTRGPSGWMHTHALLHPNGQPQLINFIKEHYKL